MMTSKWLPCENGYIYVVDVNTGKRVQDIHLKVSDASAGAPNGTMILADGVLIVKITKERSVAATWCAMLSGAGCRPGRR